MLKKLSPNIFDNPVRLKILKGFGFIASERMLRICLNVFVQFLMARRLGPEVFGDITLVTKYVGVFMAIPIFGLDEIVVRELVHSKDEVQKSRIVTTIIAFRFWLALIAYLLLSVSLIFADIGRADIVSLILIYGLTYFLFPLLTFELVYQQKIDLKKVFQIRTLGSVGVSICRVVGSVMLAPVAAFIAFNLMEYIYLAARFAMAGLMQLPKITQFEVDRGLLRKVVPEALPLAIATILLLLDHRAALVFVERFASPAQLGVFTLSLTVMDVLQYFPVAIGIATYPALVNLYRTQPLKFGERLQAVINSVFLISATLLLVHLAIGEELIRIGLGERYNQLPEVITWILSLNFIFSIDWIRIRIFAISGRLYYWLIFSALTLTMSVLLQYFLSREFGMIGVFYAWAAAQIISNFVGIIFLAEIRDSFLKLMYAPLDILTLVVSRIRA